nr:PoNe immunity protein domain-containing protein [Acinetobacter sp. YH12140]
MGFDKKKRQFYLTEDNFITFADHYREYIDYWFNNVGGSGDNHEQKKKLAMSTHAEYSYNLFSLLLTSGYKILDLRLIFEDVIIAYEKYTIAFRAAEKDNDWAPFYFTAIDEYERCMQLIGLCYLLHRRDLLPRIAAMQDKIYHEQTEQLDTLYEDFLSFELMDRYDVDQWFFDNPYRSLIFSKYRDTKKESIQDIQEYLKLWYPAFESAPWYDLHKMEVILAIGL